MKWGVSVMLLTLSLTSGAQCQISSDTSASDIWAVKNDTAVPSTPAEKRKAILMPKYYTRWVGTSMFTIENMEKELNVRPVQISGRIYFYYLDNCFVGMVSLENGVIVQMNLRLYGYEATDFMQKAMDYGFKHVGNGENINTRSSNGVLYDVYETDVKRYSIATDHGSIYIEVATTGRYAGEYEIVIYRAK